jgi:hypothetical protein
MQVQVIDGRAEGIPISLSRWTDVPAAKWGWFMAQMAQGYTIAFDPRTAVPGRWSLKAETTLGMVWWTKNPEPLIREYRMFAGHNMKVHVTITGWEEVERGAPKTEDSAEMACRAAELYGKENVTWRFSPVPLVEDAVRRFERIAKIVGPSGINRTYLSFLQTNDRVSETRSREDRLQLLVDFATIGEAYGIKVLLCNEDRLLAKVSGLPTNLGSGVCQAPEDFSLLGYNMPPSEGCGCVLMADPFTINESCTLGCTYCYASDKSLSDKKRNTTRSLPVVR